MYMVVPQLLEGVLFQRLFFVWSVYRRELLIGRFVVSFVGDFTVDNSVGVVMVIVVCRYMVFSSAYLQFPIHIPIRLLRSA